MIKPTSLDPVSLYEACCDKLIEEFIIYMGYESGDGYWIGSDAGTCQINDQFWSPYDIYVTLKYQINPDIVFDWSDDIATQKTTLGLYGYWKTGKYEVPPVNQQ